MNPLFPVSSSILSIARRRVVFGGTVIALAPPAAIARVPGLLPGGPRRTYVPAPRVAKVQEAK